MIARGKPPTAASGGEKGRAVSERKVVFIMGNGHSGSTLLELILGSHPEVFGLGEIVNATRAVDQKGGGAPKLCRICEGECAFWNRKADLAVLRRLFSRRNWLAALRGELARWHRNLYDHLFDWTGARILVDGSKRVSWITRQLRPSWRWRDTDPVLLYIVRDGRAVVNSKLRKYPEKTIDQEVRHWQRIVDNMEALYARFPPQRRYRLHYEDLARQPERTIRALCDFLGLGFQDAMLRYWEHEHHTTFGNASTRSLIARYREQFGSGGAGGGALTHARHGSHYEQVGLAIRLDERWKRELSAEQLAVFEKLGGEANRRLMTAPTGST